MKKRKYKILVGDFETTVYDNQESTEVWVSAIVELFTEDVTILSSIEDTLKYLCGLKENIIIYYHNLKFDGNFWLDYLLRKGFKFNRVAENKMSNKEFKCSISDKGQWYTIVIKVKDIIIEIRDSLKLLPFSVERIGKSFGTKHRKKNMEYKGFRYSGCMITEEEKEYIRNDVLVVKEALEILYKDGHNRLTIGSCCFEEFKKGFDKEDFSIFFPNLHEIPISSEYNANNAGDYIRKGYVGGWCYLKRGMEGKIYTRGYTVDVNSLYPSVMHSESGNRYPVGKPMFWSGNYIPNEALEDNKYYYIRIRCRFKLKVGYLPTVQIKFNLLYRGTEYLETSEIYDTKNECYSRYYEKEGNIIDTHVTLTMTQTNHQLFLDHYHVYDYEILDGCYFMSEIGLFDSYINKYRDIKLNSKGAVREEAKLFLNNLYGKLASSTDSSYKLPFLDEEKNIVRFDLIPEFEKTPGYIAAGAAVTSYAREFTIRAAQLNYENFIYADTDSCHLLGPINPKGITLDDVKFNCWKVESIWDEAIYDRQKTYIERVLPPKDKPGYHEYVIRCAGMPAKCKKEFSRHYKLKDFKRGLEIGGKLRPKRIAGGIVLVETTFTIK